MAGKGNYHIDWDDFTTTSSDRFRNIIGKKEFSDVTLVCIKSPFTIECHYIYIKSPFKYFLTKIPFLSSSAKALTSYSDGILLNTINAT